MVDSISILKIAKRKTNGKERKEKGRSNTVWLSSAFVGNMGAVNIHYCLHVHRWFCKDAQRNGNTDQLWGGELVAGGQEWERLSLLDTFVPSEFCHSTNAAKNIPMTKILEHVLKNVFM